MRNFEVILTYRSLSINHLVTENILISKKKVLEIELEESHCYSPEEFCDAVIEIKERHDVVRINVVEKNITTDRQLNWITENFGRIYFHNGIPLILHRN